MSFSSLGLSDALIRAIADLGYHEPTPVQTAAIPEILRGRDVWASAQTGSGKTAGFLLPLIERLNTSRRGSPRVVRGLVLAPTRELVAQLAESVRNYSCRLADPIKTCIAIGGVSINPQMMALRGGADLVIATPGRLLDLVERNAVRLDRVETLVLDEADRLFNLGFAEELGRVLALLPSERQNLLFSATFPPPVRAFAESLLREPIRINVDQGAMPAQAILVQRAIEVDAGRRTMLLRHLITTHNWASVLVFVATKYATEHVAMKLQRAGIAAAPLHGELSQGARTQAVADLKARRIQVVVATDVAARGLDIEQLSAVVNYDLPRSPADYVHRVGRTGRAGESGVAVSFISASTDAHFRLIERRNRMAVEREQVEGFEPVELAPMVRDVNGGIKGKRKSKKDRLREAAARAAGGATPEPPPKLFPAEPLFPFTPPENRRR